MISNNDYSQKENPIAARVFVLIPEKNDNAILLRRGPSKIVGVFQWNIKSDKVVAFQWLKGRIYEYFSDISPNGKYFIYSANKKGNGYTAISQSPWLKAISFWNNAGGRGGGIFSGKKQYILYDGSDNYSNYLCEELTLSTTGWQQLEHGVYPARLQRSGWKILSKQQSGLVFIKKISDNILLEKVWERNVGKSNTGKGEFSEYHRVIINSNVIEYPKWEWCEWLKNNLVWSENGCLFRASLANKARIQKPMLIHDFNQEEFGEKQAPY